MTLYIRYDTMTKKTDWASSLDKVELTGGQSMQTKSNDGNFVITVPDTAKIGSRFAVKESELEDEIEVRLETVKKNVSLKDLIDTIANELFGNYGMRLHAKKLKCHVTAGKNTYEFIVKPQPTYDLYYHEIAEQLKI